jgi:hypothetical protein
MSNKENLWRLQDEEGKPVADKPKKNSDVKFMMLQPDGKYKEIMQLQSLNLGDAIRTNHPIREIGSVRPIANPVHEVTMPVDIEMPIFDVVAEATREHARQLEQRIYQSLQEEVAILEGNPFDGTAHVRTETIQQRFPDILDLLMREHHRYEGRFNQSPEYLSLSKEAYHSFWVETRNRGFRRGSRTLGEEHFMGIRVICHPYQDHPVLALGNAEQEGIEGRLYRD